MMTNAPFGGNVPKTNRADLILCTVAKQTIIITFKQITTMKKLLLTTSLSLLCIVGTWAADFSAQSGSNKLFYEITNETAMEVAVVNETGSWKAPYTTKPTGTLIIPEKVAYLGLEYSVTSIGNDAFYECTGLSGNITISNSIKTIGEYAFNGCSGLSGSLTIGNSVVSIGVMAFNGCSNLSAVYNYATTPQVIDANVFNGITIDNIDLYVPKSAMSAYNNNAVWGGFSEVIDISNAVGYKFSAQSGTNKLFYQITDANAKTVEVVSELNYADDYKSYNTALTGALTIPETVTHNGADYSVTSIGGYAFCDCEGLTGNLTIPDGVKSIGNNAFYKCTNLTGNLTIPDGVVSIGDNAFCFCKDLTGNLTIPSSVATIGESAFYDCSGLSEVYNYATSPQAIDANVFDGVTIGNINLYVPKSAISLYNNAQVWGDFKDIIAISSIVGYKFSVQSGNNKLYYQITDADAKTVALVNETGDWENPYTTKPSGALTIPETVTDNGTEYSVTSIGEDAFYNCSGLSGNLTIPSNVKTIGKYAFNVCTGLTGTLTIPNSVESIGEYAFYSCKGLSVVYNYATTPQVINANVFGNVTIGDMNLYVPAEAKTAYKGADVWENFGNVIAIGSAAVGYKFSAQSGDNKLFYQITDADANTVAVVTELVPSAENDWESYTTVPTGTLTIPETVTYNEVEYSVTSIGKGAFSDCTGLSGNLTIPNNVTSIGDAAFAYCSGLSGDLTIPNNVESIGDGAFYGCSGFKGNLTIGNSVESIKDEAFAYCSGLTAVYNYARPQGIDVSVFEDVTIGNINLYVPAEIITDYEGAEVWEDFQELRAIGQLYAGDKFSVQSGDNPLYYKVTDADAKTVELVTENDRYPYYTTKPTGTLTIPETVTYNEVEYSVTSIRNSAFSNCYDLTGTLTIPNSVVTIGNHAFNNCDGLTGSLTIPNSVVSIGEKAFYNCSGFKGSITIGDGVTSIVNDAFCNCIGLTGFIVDNNNTTYASQDSILYSKDLTTLILCPSGLIGILNIPDGVTSIEEDAFDGCSGITEFVVNDANANYSSTDGMLYNKDKTTIIRCPVSLTGTLTIPDGVMSIGDYAFLGCDGFGGDLIIPDGVTSIGYCAFADCDGFTGTLTIPNSVDSIAKYAFSRCDSLTAVYNYATTPQVIAASVFGSVSIDTINLYVPEDAIADYEGAEVWKGFKAVEAAPEISQSVKQMNAPAPFTQVGNTLYFSEPIAVAVYNLSGVMIYSGAITEYTLPSRKGIYIICTEVGTYKIVVE